MISTYSELVTTTTGFLHNSAAAGMVPALIALAEAKFNRDLRTEDMVTSFTSTITAPEIALPADYLEAVSVSVGGDALDFRVRTQFFALEGDFYTRIGNKLALAKQITDPADVDLIYYARIPALTDTNTTNWLLDRAPDLYLYAVLLEAAPYMRLGVDDPRPAQWQAGMNAVIDSILRADEASRFSGQALTIRIAR